MAIEKVRRRGDVVCVIADGGYLPHIRGKTLLTLRDTGNGYIARAPGFELTSQDTYLCMDYAIAHDLWLALSMVYADRGDLK